MDARNKQRVADAVRRGVAHYERGKLDEAVAQFTEAIRLDPANAEAYYRRGLAYDDMERVDVCEEGRASAQFRRPRKLAIRNVADVFARWQDPGGRWLGGRSETLGHIGNKVGSAPRCL